MKWRTRTNATALSVVIACGVIAAIPAVASPSIETSWTVYHGDAEGTGLSTALASVTTSTPRWTSPVLDGQLYGEPLVFGSDVYVATEGDTVYALSAHNGAVVWSRHLATPVPSSALPCGDISPSVGITGTPVLDPTRGELFVVADTYRAGVVAHRLFGVNAATGAIELSVDVDPRGSYPPALLQRTGLNLDRGQVIFGFGGNYGDCSTYRGRVVEVPETGGRPRVFTVDDVAGDSQGAVWMGGGAPAVDGRGDVWVSTGNGSVHSAGQRYDDSDAALDLTSRLGLRQYFAPTSWYSDNASDLDMSSVPALLSDGQVVLAGKSQVVYLLDGSHLGAVGPARASLSGVCGNDVDGGAAVRGAIVYLPCVNGPVAIRVGASPPSLRVLWSARVGGGPPIVAAGLVWTIGQNGVLYGLDRATGAVRQSATIGAPANHFPTPSVGDGLLLAPSENRVVAFAGAT